MTLIKTTLTRQREIDIVIILHYKADLEFYYQTAAEVGEAGMKVEANLTVPEDKDADYVSWYKSTPDFKLGSQ